MNSVLCYQQTSFCSCYATDYVTKLQMLSNVKSAERIFPEILEEEEGTIVLGNLQYRINGNCNLLHGLCRRGKESN